MDPQMRSRLVDEATNGPYEKTAAAAEARPPDWNIMRVLDSPVEPYRTVAEVARERNTTPADVMIDLSLASDFEQFFLQAYANHDLNQVLEIMQAPGAVIGGSDSGAHVSQILDSSIPTFALAYWVRQKGAFTLEEAVRKLTFDPAMVWSLRDRGLIAPGLIADLVVFDPERISPGMPTADSDLPAGGMRLKQKATGIHASIVGGRVLLCDGEHTGDFPGRLLRGPLAAQHIRAT
jgi:N-acyl-D-aspartate/D-glutamate deacylase